MSDTIPTHSIGIYGPDLSKSTERHGCGLWQAGLAASVAFAGGIPVVLGDEAGRNWEDQLATLHGLVLTGHDKAVKRLSAEAEALCQWCHEHRLPLLAIDHGLHILNVSHGGTVHHDLARDLPEALQHRHPPERGLRHAINVIPETLMAELYGEGEVVVNSEHRRAVARLARGFRVGANALDGVVEAIEYVGDWFALGVQWQPASATASGLDIQLFRGLLDACRRRQDAPELVECDAA
jgi:gamma-glutamyl-gamma-aminobutyrate hydrolase PuuD